MSWFHQEANVVCFRYHLLYGWTSVFMETMWNVRYYKSDLLPSHKLVVVAYQNHGSQWDEGVFIIHFRQFTSLMYTHTTSDHILFALHSMYFKGRAFALLNSRVSFRTKPFERSTYVRRLRVHGLIISVLAAWIASLPPGIDHNRAIQEISESS